MNDINEILREYTNGEADLEETNAALEEAGAPFRLDPERNTLTEEELDAAVTGDTPEEASGFGLLDAGAGTLDKVHVTDGVLDYAVNEVQADGSTNMTAYVFIGGKRYDVKGDKLAEATPRKPAKREKLPKTPDLRRRCDLAEQDVVQHTLHGDFLVSYDAFGYAVKAVKEREE